jgi:DMSO reductase family type II enzyme chaperone
MPTPSELQNERPRRSVFANYSGSERESALPHQPTIQSTRPETPTTLQRSIDLALGRTFLYRYLAQAFEDPEPETWQWLTAAETANALHSAINTITTDTTSPERKALRAQRSALCAEHSFEDFATAHLTCFGHTVRGECPMNEIEYGDIQADPLFQPHRLSDLGAFFAAFGLELAPDAAERIDHISIELEFMTVLTAKEAHALEHQFNDEAIAMLRDAQKKFLREHLGRWSPAFSRRLARMAEGTPLGSTATLLGEFIKLDCARLNIPAGSEDLLLRPVDDSMERLCDTCGIHTLPPGAATTGAKL